jgi:hypothetical protein
LCVISPIPVIDGFADASRDVCDLTIRPHFRRYPVEINGGLSAGPWRHVDPCRWFRSLSKVIACWRATEEQTQAALSGIHALSDALIDLLLPVCDVVGIPLARPAVESARAAGRYELWALSGIGKGDTLRSSRVAGSLSSAVACRRSESLAWACMMLGSALEEPRRVVDLTPIRQRINALRSALDDAGAMAGDEATP